MHTTRRSMSSTLLATIAYIVLSLAAYAQAWSFNISSEVVQCANLSVTWNGGTAPWELVLVPVGALPSGPEIRTIVDANITSGNSYSFQLKFPSGSSFLAMMNDATGIGTGGTSVLITVLPGSDSSCLSTTATSPDFYLYLDSTSAPDQCGTWGVSTQTADVEPPVRITAMIPGGESFALPAPASGDHFNWTVDMPQGTQFILVAGDSRGFGTGGSTELYTVQGGSSSCLNTDSPSSTAAPAAGGIYATGSGAGTVTGAAGPGPQTTQAANSGGTHKSTNVGAIVGGTIGGVAGLIALLLLGLFFWRRRRFHKQQDSEKPVDLLTDDHTPGTTAGAGLAGGAAAMGRDSNSRPLSAEPLSGGRRSESSFAGTDTPIYQHHRRSQPSSDGGPLSDSTHGAYPNYLRTSSHGPNPPSAFPAGGAVRPETPTTVDGTSVRTPQTQGAGPTSKSGMPQPGVLRPVNIVQHEDAGVLHGASPTSDDHEVVELPPSYNEVGQNPQPGSA